MQFWVFCAHQLSSWPACPGECQPPALHSNGNPSHHQAPNKMLCPWDLDYGKHTEKSFSIPLQSQLNSYRFNSLKFCKNSEWKTIFLLLMSIHLNPYLSFRSPSEALFRHSSSPAAAYGFSSTRLYIHDTPLRPFVLWLISPGESGYSFTYSSSCSVLCCPDGWTNGW